MSTSWQSSDNTTAQQLSLFPSDVNDHLLFLIRDVTFASVPSGLFLGFIVAVTSFKTLSELASSFPYSKAKKPIKQSWIVSKLKSKYTPPLIVCGNGTSLVLIEVLWLLTYFDTGGEAACGTIQRSIVVLYVLNLWTTYLLFEIRRISTGTEDLKGIRYLIMQSVRFCTLSMPIFAIMGCFSTSGIYLPDVGHCIQIVDPLLTVLFGVADGMLSMGHILVFIFAVSQKSNFKVVIVGTSNRIKPSVSSKLSHMQSNLALMNRNLALSQNDAAIKIKAIATRNLRLALVTVTSTAVAMVITSWANIASPPIDSPSARSYLYLRHVSMLAGNLDANVNSISILIMTSSWQSACLKKMSMKIRATVAPAHDEGESDVSTLGGS